AVCPAVLTAHDHRRLRQLHRLLVPALGHSDRGPRSDGHGVAAPGLRQRQRPASAREETMSAAALIAPGSVVVLDPSLKPNWVPLFAVPLQERDDPKHTSDDRWKYRRAETGVLLVLAIEPGHPRDVLREALLLSNV